MQVFNISIQSVYSQTLIFLGIEINTVEHTATLLKDKLDKLQENLSSTGSLLFACKIVKPGRLFIWCLFAGKKNHEKQLGFKRILSGFQCFEQNSSENALKGHHYEKVTILHKL